MEGSLADMILEVGYGCTSSIEECRNTLVQLGVREITAASVARVLSMMARTPAGLTDHISVQVSPVYPLHNIQKAYLSNRLYLIVICDCYVTYNVHDRFEWKFFYFMV